MTQATEHGEATAVRLAKLEAILATAVNAIISIDGAGTIDSANAATTALFGYELAELIGKNVKILMPEPFAGEHDGYLTNYLASGKKKIIGIGRVVTGRRKDGSEFPIHLAVSEYMVSSQRHFTGIITDLSERKAAKEALQKAEDHLARAQRMETVGQLAGGIAHDFNNLLSVITGSQEILEMRLHDEKDLALLRRAQEAAEMGARLTERMLTFARRKRLEPTEINLNDQITGMAEMLRRSMGEHIALTTNLAARLWTVRADASQIENAILNLAINARDAMPDGGTLMIETANQAAAVDTGGASTGDRIRLSVSDTGTGMPPEILQRVFEPFFTTKPTGKGTGLGLSTIYGFVTQSGGSIEINSDVGRGTTIDIYLPRSPDAPKAAGKVHGAALSMATGETILLVEDNAAVRETARERIEGLGYYVIEAETGSAAIAILAEPGHDIQLVFSDVVMPGGVSGYDVARWVLAHAPEVKVLLTSGYPEEVASSQGEPLPAVALLRKPFSRAELAEALRQALNG